MAHVYSSRTIDALELADLYEWLDRIPLSKTRNHVERDFADGILAAEIVKFYFPELVDMRIIKPVQNLTDRTNQWKELNSKVFNKIGLNVPSQVITQLSIGKTGVAQIFLSNLRTSLSLTGVNTLVMPIVPGVVHPNIYNDPLWLQKNNFDPRQKFPRIYQDEYDFYWQKKQNERVLKSDKSRKQLLDESKKAISHPLISPTNLFPPLINPYGAPHLAPHVGLAAAKLEIDSKHQQILQKEDEVRFLRSQLSRMETLMQSKDAKIKELMAQLDRQKKRN